MAPLPVIPLVYRVAFHWHNAKFPRDAVNVMHFHHSAGDPTAVYNDIAAHVNVSMWGHTESGSKIARLLITELDGSSASVEFTTPGTTNWNGAASPSEVIPAAAALVKLTTANRGRSARGRVFLPWVVESVQADGKLASATITNMQNAWNTFGAAMSTALTPLVVASYKNASFGLVTGQLVETPLATQRRRQDR